MEPSFGFGAARAPILSSAGGQGDVQGGRGGGGGGGDSGSIQPLFSASGCFDAANPHGPGSARPHGPRSAAEAHKDMATFESFRQRAIYSGRTPAPRPAWVKDGAGETAAAASAVAPISTGIYGGRARAAPEPYILDDAEGILPAASPNGVGGRSVGAGAGTLSGHLRVPTAAERFDALSGLASSLQRKYAARGRARGSPAAGSSGGGFGGGGFGSGRGGYRVNTTALGAGFRSGPHGAAGMAACAAPRSPDRFARPVVPIRGPGSPLERGPLWESTQHYMAHAHD